MWVTHAAADWQWANPKPQGNTLNAIEWNAKNGQFVAVGAAATLLVSNDGATWEPAAGANLRVLSSSEDLNAISVDGPRNVAVGSNGGVYSSSDGKSWIRSADVDAALYEVLWNGSRYVAVGAAATVLLSDDGLTWSRATAPGGATLYGVAWTGSDYVAVGEAGTVVRSADGGSWVLDSTTAAAGMAAYTLRDVAFGAGRVVVVVDPDSNFPSTRPTVIFVQESAAAWTRHSVKDDVVRSSQQLQKILYDGKQFVAVGGADYGIDYPITVGEICTSDEGRQWGCNKLADHMLRGLAFGASLRVAVGDVGEIVVNESSLWQGPPHPQDSTTFLSDLCCLEDIAWGQGNWVAVGHSYVLGPVAITSRDGIAWRARQFYPYWYPGEDWDFVTAAAYGESATLPGRFFALLRDVQGCPSVQRSVAPFEQWQSLPLQDPDPTLGYPPGCLTVEDIAWNGARFVVVGASGAIASTRSGDNFAWRVPVTDRNLRAVTAKRPSGNTQFVAVGEGGTVVTSDDGLDPWTAHDTGINVTLTDVASSGSMYVAVGLGGTILTSSNGSSWQQAVSNTTRDLRGIFWDGELFMAVGDDGVMVSSANGVRWLRAARETDRALTSGASADEVRLVISDAGAILRQSKATPAENPTADGGADQRAVAGDTVVLAGTATAAVGRTLRSYTWTVLSGSPVPTLLNASSASVSFVAPDVTTESTFVLQFTVTDDQSAVGSDEVTVVVTPRAPTTTPVIVTPPPVALPPHVVADADTQVSSGAALSVSSQGSDPDGEATALRYVWTFVGEDFGVSLAGADTPTVSFVAPSVREASTLTLSVTVTDPQGLSASDEVALTILPTPSAETPSNPSPQTGGSGGGGSLAVFTLLILAATSRKRRRIEAMAR
jgi:hypothetical protein